MCAFKGWRHRASNLSMRTAVVIDKKAPVPHTQSASPLLTDVGNVVVNLFKSEFKQVTHTMFDRPRPLEISFIFLFYCLFGFLEAVSVHPKLSWNFGPPSSCELGVWACATTPDPLEPS